MERSSSRAITALLVAIISVPLSSQAIFRSQDQDGRLSENLGDMRQEVYEYQSGERQMIRRAYSRAIEDYRERLKRGEQDAIKPDINNPSTFRDFLKEVGHSAARSPRVRSAASSSSDREAVRADSTEDLTTRQRMLLRNYTRAGSCPPSMERLLPGFHVLCKNIVGNTAETALPRGMMNDLQRARRKSIGPATIKLRMEMIRQANDPSTRRTGGAVPGRPKPYIGE
ncbi:hypothetical protein FJZ27_03505 [Candidatus Peribacteria bacterium]|nr:hypothetical protein [Candidatus Peribacteria bacterium]